VGIYAEASFTAPTHLTDAQLVDIRDIAASCGYGESVDVRTERNDQGKIRLYVGVTLESDDFRNGLARKVVVEDLLRRRLTEQFLLTAE
jgi:hypothetical protein